MNRNGHLGMEMLVTSAVSWQLDQPLWQRALSPVIGLATAMACDVDNTRWWQEIRQHIPIKIVRQALRHRGLTHSWMIVVGLWYAQDHPGWAYVALLSGYASHLVADALFGKTGIPLFLWYLYFGLHLPMGKRLENLVTVVATTYAAFTIFLGWYEPAHVLLVIVGFLATSVLGWLFMLVVAVALIVVVGGGRREKNEAKREEV